MGFATVLAERRTFGGVKMGWDEVPVVPPTVTMSCPYNSIEGDIQALNVSVNQIATIEFFLDDNPEPNQTSTGMDSSFILPVNVGRHDVTVIVSNSNGRTSQTCSWVVYQLVPLPDEDELISENECPFTNVGNATLSFMAKLYKKPDGRRYVMVKYYGHGCTSYSSDPDAILVGCHLSFNIQVWWDPITIPYSTEFIDEFDSCSINSYRHCYIPSTATYADIFIELTATCIISVLGVTTRFYASSSCNKRLISTIN